MPKTYFISGHRNVTDEEFEVNYESKIFDAINEGSKFVVGDCVGVDNLAQKYLKAMMVDPNDVSVFHMFDSPKHNAGYPLVGGFRSDHERDFAMTKASDVDIAWIRKGMERSGTDQNLDRRKWLAKNPNATLQDLMRRESHNFM